MILSDTDLRAALDSGALTITPPPQDRAIQPASIELHLGDQFRRVDSEPFTNLGQWWFQPGDFLLGHTVETVTIGRTIAAQLNGKSTLARLGLTIHKTAGWIDPGFEGQIVLELSTRKPILLTSGMAIGQLVVMQLLTPATRLYGDDELGSRYMGQTGAVAARIGEPR